MAHWGTRRGGQGRSTKVGGVTLSSGEGAGEGMGYCASWEKIDGWTLGVCRACWGAVSSSRVPSWP